MEEPILHIMEQRCQMMVQPIIDDSLKYLGAGVQQRDRAMVTRSCLLPLFLYMGTTTGYFQAAGKTQLDREL